MTAAVIHEVLDDRDHLKAGTVALKALLAATAHGSTDAVAALMAERDAARDEAARLRAALEGARDTFSDIARACRGLGHPKIGIGAACDMAYEGCVAALAPASAAPQERPE